MYCPNCSCEVKEGARFCPMCGCDLTNKQPKPQRAAAVQKPVQPTPPKPKKGKKKRKAAVVIVPLLLVLVIAAVVLFVALKPGISKRDAQKALDLLNSEELSDIKGDSEQDKQNVKDYLIKLEGENKIQQYTENENGVFFEYKGVKTGYVFDADYAESKLVEIDGGDTAKKTDDNVLFLICADEGKEYYKRLAEKYKSKTSGKVTVIENAGTDDFVREMNSEYDNVFICSHGAYWNGEYGVFCLSETATADLIAKYAAKENSSIVVYRKIGSDKSYIGLTPDFFKNECANMKCDTVYSSACHSFDNNVMPQTIVSAGAQSFAGFDGQVTIQYDENIAGVFSNSLIDGSTAKEAYTGAVNKCGKRSGASGFCFYEKPEPVQSNPSDDTSGDQPSAQPSGEAIEPAVSQTDPDSKIAQIKWVKEPFLEADYVSPLFNCTGAEYSDNPLYAYRSSTSSGKEYGVVDLEGKKLISGEGGAYFDCVGEVVTDHVGHSNVRRGVGAVDRIYDGFHQYSDYGLEPNSEWLGLYVADAYFDDNSSDPNASVYGENITEAKCGLWCDHEFVVPMEYDGYMIPSDGITALKKDDLWYYFDSDGNCILSGIEPLDNEYAKDAFNESYDQDIVLKTTGAYGFSCGLLPVRNSSGKWGYVDANGDKAIEYEFEDATPFRNGRAWAKKDGKWGIIEIEEMADAYEQYEKIINEAYDKLEKERETKPDAGYNFDKLTYKICFIDDNFVPELIIDRNVIYIELYTMNNGNPQLVFKEDDIDPEDVALSSLRTSYKAGLFSVYSGLSEVEEYAFNYKLENSKVSLLKEYFIGIEIDGKYVDYYDLGSTLIPTSYDNINLTNYKKVSDEEFDKQIESYGAKYTCSEEEYLYQYYNLFTADINTNAYY